MQVDCPSPILMVCATASYVKVPDFDTIPILPLAWICPGMIPILQPPLSPGVIIPGQFGPMSLIPSLSFT